MTFNNLIQAIEFEEKVKVAKKIGEDFLRKLAADSETDLLFQIKFSKIGIDPLYHTPLNLIEQVNQTYTLLVTAEALKYLFKHHSQAAPFIISPGPQSGTDIFSEDKLKVAVETFAAVDPNNNQKLKKDIIRVSETKAKHKYVFYYSPVKEIPSYAIRNDVKVFRVEL